MKLSILDQVPILPNQTAKDALNASLKLAKAGERWGYTRYWVAEHHSFSNLACSAPEVLLGYIGANTHTIRIGSGAILLPHYKPYKVAEIANMLATLFPDRVDLGIGRAPGGSAEATNALSNHFLQEVWKMPEKIKELLSFIDDQFPSDHPHANVVATPLPDTAPQLWLLGTNKKSAQLAAENGLPYAFGHFMSESDGRGIINEYRSSFKPRKLRDLSRVIITVSVLCAETREKAEMLALQNNLLKKQFDHPPLNDDKNQKESRKELLLKLRKNMIIGSPSEVKAELETLYEHYQIDEIMIITNAPQFEDRLKSYEWLASYL